MGRQQEQERPQRSIRSKAVHLVSDITTVILNPISDKPSNSKPIIPPPPPTSEDDPVPTLKSISEEDSGYSVVGPDTSSFTAFLRSLLSSSESTNNSDFDISNEYQVDSESSTDKVLKDNGSRKKSLISRGKQSLGRAISQASRLGGYRNQASAKGSSDMSVDEGNKSKAANNEEISIQNLSESIPLDNLPETSEPSLLMSEKTRGFLYGVLPLHVQGRKWILLYSTWRHGISLSTLYRRSMLLPGFSLLVVGDQKGAVFGGLVEAPLRPTSKKRYQGTNTTFVFTNTTGRPVVYCPTGVNRYFTLCSAEYLALGGGAHFALYLDGDLLNGSSKASETYGNSCLAHTEDFEVKEIELWGFVYASKYEEMVSLLRTEAPGICRW